MNKLKYKNKRKKPVNNYRLKINCKYLKFW